VREDPGDRRGSMRGSPILDRWSWQSGRPDKRGRRLIASVDVRSEREQRGRKRKRKTLKGSQATQMHRRGRWADE